ncbi:MAG: dihydroneopterin aldolase, partial [Pseudomonadota bacterium]
NVEVEVAHSDEPISDDVDRILSYDTIVQSIHAALAAERLNLLETLAERIADLLLQEPRARRVHVRIEKLDRGPFALGVDICRDRQLAVIGPVERPAPMVVHLGQTAIEDDRLPNWLDQIEALGHPVILTVVSHDLAVPHANITPARRRIALLAIEQNAWVLAGRDPRCVVVSTRTEIEWAIDQGQMTVWAPSKMVLDAVERPDTASQDATVLAEWFAATMGAREFLGLGIDPGASGRMVPLDETLAL